MKKPILGIRCNQCGRVYFGHALASPIDDETQKEIMEAANRGDDFFTADAETEEFKLEMCNCDKL